MTGFDTIMARASRELVDMDYLACEAHCLEALGLARAEGDFTAVRRALRPLQEARRARRMLAADAAVYVGPDPGAPEGPGAGGTRPEKVVASGAGCVCLTGDPAAATARLARARAGGLHAEVLVGEPLPGASGRWAVAAPPAPGGPPDRGLFPAKVPAPPAAMIGRALHPDETLPSGSSGGSGGSPRHWFVAAGEAVGDSALAWAEGVAPAGTVERLAALELAVGAVADHELLHQALADAAGALELAGGGGLG